MLLTISPITDLIIYQIKDLLPNFEQSDWDFDSHLRHKSFYCIDCKQLALIKVENVMKYNNGLESIVVLQVLFSSFALHYKGKKYN